MKMTNKVIYINDFCRPNDDRKIIVNGGPVISSTLQFIDDATGEPIFEPLHNKTVIAGGGFTLQKLFSLDRRCLNNTPTYDEELGLDDAASISDYPTMAIKDSEGTMIGSVEDETQRVICGFCLGSAGAGMEATNTFNEVYSSWIYPDALVPFRYPLESTDNVDENIYKGRKTITLSNGQVRCAYYFKEFANTPELVQNHVSSIETFENSISPRTVYDVSQSDKAQSFVELHLKVTSKDCREFYIAHSGLERAKINQVSLVTAWKKTVSRTKLNTQGSVVTNNYEVLQQIRPFSLCNFPTEILKDRAKSISIIYTLYC